MQTKLFFSSQDGKKNLKFWRFHIAHYAIVCERIFLTAISTENTPDTVACTVVFVGPAHFVFTAYPGRNVTCPLSSFSNKNALTVFLSFLVKDPFV